MYIFFWILWAFLIGVASTLVSDNFNKKITALQLKRFLVFCFVSIGVPSIYSALVSSTLDEAGWLELMRVTMLYATAFGSGFLFALLVRQHSWKARTAVRR
jgi:hypothetical protein